MSHGRSDSKASQSSAVSTTSGLTLESTGSNREINELIDDQIDTAEHVASAKRRLISLKQRNPDLVIPQTTLSVHSLLSCMLEFAPCARGERYAACAISRCNVDEKFANLASDWFHFLLLPFKCAYKTREEYFSQDSTPTEEDTMTKAESRLKAFHDDVKKRDGGKCVVLTKYENAVVNAAHILRRAVTVDDDSDAGLHSVPSTWDILRHYADISDDDIANMDECIDSPRNGMLLEIGMHHNFDAFLWCLKEVGENQYEVVWLTDKIPSIFPVFKGDIVEFAPRDGIKAPDPRFIGAHAAVAQVHEKSGAGEYLDQVMDAFIPDVSAVKASKLDARDFEIRLFVKSLVDGENCHHLPSSMDYVVS